VSSARSSGLKYPTCGPSGFTLLPLSLLMQNRIEEVFHRCSSVTSPCYSPLICYFFGVDSIMSQPFAMVIPLKLDGPN
jgi:hypothetical protein